MKWLSRFRPAESKREEPRVEDARRQLEAARRQRVEAEKKAERIRWHLRENDFRRHVLGLLEEDAR